MPELPEQGCMAKIFEAVRRYVNLQLSQHVPGCCLCRSLTSLRTPDRNMIASLHACKVSRLPCRSYTCVSKMKLCTSVERFTCMRPPTHHQSSSGCTTRFRMRTCRNNAFKHVCSDVATTYHQHPQLMRTCCCGGYGAELWSSGRNRSIYQDDPAS